MSESGRYRVNGHYPMMGQFMLDKEGLIGQVDMSTLMRYRKNQNSYTAKHKLQLIDEDGKRIIGPVFMRGSHLYAYGKDGIYIKS